MLNSTKYWLVSMVTVVVVVVISCNKPKVNVANTSTSKTDSTLVSLDNGRFTFHMNGSFRDLRKEAVYSQLLEVNSNLLIMVLIDLPQQSIVISVQKYVDRIKNSIDKAFEITVHSKALFNNQSVGKYKLIDYGVYNFEDKTLRFKVSSVGDTMVNTMYYFMKDNYDYDLYELKISCSKKSQYEARKYLEKMALTVVIK